MAKADSTEDEVLDQDTEDVDNDESQDEIEEVNDSDTEVEDEETGETNDDSEDDSDSDDSEEEDSNDDEDEDDSETSFNKRYTQLKGDTPEEYISSLETAYKESSTEAVRLKHELDAAKKKDDKIAALLANHPEIAEELEKETPGASLNPALLHAEEQLQKQMKSEYQAFVDEHPELETDPELQKSVLGQMTIYADTVRQTQRRQPSMKESLRFAWASLGREDSKQERLAVKAKETAARGKSGKTAPKKPVKKVEFSEKQIEAGLKMGVGKTREEVLKKFREFAK